MFTFAQENTRCNISVGYISSERGFVDNVGIHEANKFAKLNPGTQFIFRNRDFVKYLNINEVNALTPEMMLPEQRAGADSCSGIVGLNLEGDTSKSIDVTLDTERAFTGGSTEDSNVLVEPDKVTVNFYGGGGVGVQAAPIIGIDGSILAVQVIHGGYGYKYPPIVDITDDTGNGAGVVAKSIIKTRTSDDAQLIEEFDAEEDYEEYVLDKCVPEIENVGYGQRWSPDGKVLGKWDPTVYFTKSKDPIQYEILRYQKFLATLKEGTIIEGDKIKGWWTSRQKAPLRLVSKDRVTREKFDVQHPAWGGMASKAAINNNQTSSTFGVATAFIESSFLVYTSGGQRRDLKFIFKGGDHRFEIRADDYKDNASPEEIKIKVRKNTKYTVTTTSKKGIRDQGLLREGTFGTGGDIAQRSGTSNAIFSDIAKTAPDDDDLQVEAKQGTFTVKSEGESIIYELTDSAAYNAEKNSMYGEGLTQTKLAIKDSFMNQYAISPVPPSNAVGSDNAGKQYIFEWEEEFPWDGDYVFNVQADNEAHLFLDNTIIGQRILLGAGGAAGHVLSPPQKFTQFVKKGSHTITLDLLNHQIREMKKIQKEVVATSDEVKFDISISTMFATGIIIEGLGIDVSKPYDEGTNPLKESFTKKVDYGRTYPVKITSSGWKQTESSSTTVVSFTGLNASNNPINVTNDGTRLALKDSGGSENASFVIENVTGGSAKFSADGKSIDAKGDNVQVTLSLSWNDDPTINGVAVERIKVGSKTWTHSQGTTFSPYTYVTRGDQGVWGLNDSDVEEEGIKPQSSWALANLADRYNFDKKRWEVQTSSGKWLPTTWEDLDYEGWTSITPPKPPGRQMSMEGSVTHTITLLGTKSNASDIKLKTLGEKVIAMEDLPGQDAGSADVGFFDDLVCSVNNGRFFGISGSTCNFRLDAPVGNKGGSTLRGERAHVFNTVDWITKANVQLWKINPTAGPDSDFASRFGVLPFDPTAVKKINKKRKVTVVNEPTGVPPSVKFEVGNDGKNYLKVVGNGRVKVGLEMDVDDEVGNRFGAAVSEVKIQSDDGEIILKRTGTRYEKLSGIGNFSSGKKYLIKSLGGSQTSGSFIGADKTVLQYDDAVQYGFDGRGYANVKITSVTPLSSTTQIEESYFGYPDYPNASTDDYAGFHEIIWNNLNFPEDGNYSITIVVDDNVNLTFTKPNQPDIVIEKQGFRIRGDARTGTGKSVEIKYFTAGNYTLKAVLEQIPGAPLAQGNPMVLALDIKAAFVSDEIEVISPKSWNENPMGVALTIDSPMAPKPKEEPQLQEGRCPKNPIWTTRSTTDTIATWYPVNVDKWGKFMNRYAISPLPPLGLKGTDGAGVVYRNTWMVQLPYKGFYGVKGTADDFGKLFIDGVEVLGPDTDKNFDNPNVNAPRARKIFLEKKTVKISVEIENEKQFIWQSIDQKIFSTADWASKQNNTSTTIEGPKNVDVTFNVAGSTLFGSSITIFDGSLTNPPLFIDTKEYDGPQIKSTHNHNIEVGKVYDVRFTSTIGNSSPSGIQYTGLKKPGDLRYSNAKRLEFDDNSGNGFDANASFTIDNVTNGNASFAEDGKSFIVTGNPQVTLTYSWSDNPGKSGTALDTIKIGSTTWTHLKQQEGSETHTITLGSSSSVTNNNEKIELKNKGKNVIAMEDIPNDDAGSMDVGFFDDLICSATEGEFYNIQGRTCKYRILPTSTTEIVYGKGLTPGSSKDGVSYSGPPISTYATGKLGPFLTPTWTSDEDYIANFNGKTWTMTWSNVDFPEDGTYDIQAEADDKLTIKVNGIEIATAEVGNGISKTQFEAPRGKNTIELTLMNLDFNAEFARNPAVAAVKITRKVDVPRVDPQSGTALGKPWTVNPIGVSAILIPPPCPKKINGVGIVTDVIITDPGNGYPPVVKPIDPGDPSGPPAIMELDKIIPEDPGINYGPDDKVCIVNTETGEEVCFIPPKDPFGGIPEFDPRKTPPAPPGPPDPTPETDPPPPVEPDVGITAIPSVIVKGDCTNLIYTSARNTHLKIDKGVGDVPVVSRGEVKVCPPVTTTYTITGDGGDGGGSGTGGGGGGGATGGDPDGGPGTGTGANSASTVVTVVEDPDDPRLDSPDVPDLPPPPNGYRTYPTIIVRGRGTGISYKGIPVMRAVVDPIGVDPNRLIQVTDLPGLKQTGYYDGKPYYGAVFYENGIRYAGYYDTPGQKVRIYDTMIESINARVTTPPSAIQRSGTDINSNNPRLNIPGTPDNLA